MDAQQLMTLYPHATVAATPIPSASTVCVRLTAGKYLCIDTTDLAPRELALLELLTKAPVTPTQTDHWTNFLLGKTHTAPTCSATRFQLIHFQVRFTDDNQTHPDWLAALGDLFNDVGHAAFTNDHQGYLMLTTPLSLDDQADLKGLLALLDNDFYTNTHILIGSHHDDLSALPAAFALERQLFERQHHQPVTTLSTSLLPYLLTAHRQELDVLTNDFLSAPDNQQLITALYHTQGNVRQAAAHLFIHRNTLLYRIDKFERTSGFNLKAMDDLVYCYLLTLAQPEQ